MPKHAKIIKEQKITKAIYTIKKQLKLSYKKNKVMKKSNKAIGRIL